MCCVCPEPALGNGRFSIVKKMASETQRAAVGARVAFRVAVHRDLVEPAGDPFFSRLSCW